MRSKVALALDKAVAAALGAAATRLGLRFHAIVMALGIHRCRHARHAPSLAGVSAVCRLGSAMPVVGWCRRLCKRAFPAEHQMQSDHMLVYTLPARSACANTQIACNCSRKAHLERAALRPEASSLLS
jgi:hypothetical protein